MTELNQFFIICSNSKLFFLFGKTPDLVNEQHKTTLTFYWFKGIPVLSFMLYDHAFEPPP